jgi:hypothetical protein
LFAHLAGGHTVGNISSVAVPTFEESFGRQPFVDTENRVLVDRQFSGQDSHGRQAFAGPQSSAGALRADLRGDLPRDGHPRRCFDPNLHRVLSK